MSEWLRLEDGCYPRRNVVVWGIIEDEAGSRAVTQVYLNSGHADWMKVAMGSLAPMWTAIWDDETVIAYQSMVPPSPPVEAITPGQVRAYLREHGWILDSPHDARDYEKWIAPEDEACGWLPTDGNADDWYVRVKMIAWHASDIEGRPVATILWDMAGMPLRDTQRKDVL